MHGFIQIGMTSPPIHFSLLEHRNCDSQRPVGILLENDKACDLLSRLLLSQPTQLTLTNDFIDYVLSISGGNAGDLARLLKTIIPDPVSIHFLVADNIFFSLYWQNVLEMDPCLPLTYLILAKFLKAIPGQNAFKKDLNREGFARWLPLREDLQRDLSIADFLNEMARKETLEVGSANKSAFKDGTKSYLRGWIHKSLNNEKKEVYKFASPIHHWYFIFR